MTVLDSSSLKVFEGRADIGTLLVIIGVAGEGLEIVLKILEHKSRNEKFLGWCGKHKFSIEIWGGIFWLMVVSGLAMEFDGNHKAKQITDRDNIRLNAEAAAAGNEAGEANKQAALANERATSNELQVVVLQKQIADANERAAAQRRSAMELIFNAYPRNFDSRANTKLVSRLGKFAGTNIVVSSIDDPESLALAKQIEDGLRTAKWNVLPFTNSAPFRERFERFAFGGVTVVFNGSSPLPNDKAARELANGLYDAHILARYVAIPTNCRDGPDGVLVVFVGRKPTPWDALGIQLEQKSSAEEQRKFWQNVITGSGFE